jgi:hypothetical protein
MTLTELETLNHELQEALDKLGMQLLSQSKQGIELMTKRSMVQERIERGDYLPERIEDAIGAKTIDNDQEDS